jgi:ssDNA thymidine ADP-ribosyltransferase, DarT
MDRAEVSELHFITSIGNLGSILERGILSHNRAARIAHSSVASEEVQDRRQGKRLPGGTTLHSYANLYFDARNPMMYCLKDRSDLIVVRVSSDVLDIPDAVVTDGNAAAGSTRFYQSPEGLAYLDSRPIFAEFWTDPDYWQYVEKKRARSAEVLVLNLVPSRYIEGCYVDTDRKRTACLEFEALPNAVVYREVFFK